MTKEPIVKLNTRCNPTARAKLVLLFVFSLILFSVSLASQLYVTNELAVKGKEIVTLEQKRLTLEKDISEMELEQSKYSSLKYIEEEALKLGFRKNTGYALTISPVTVTASLATF